MTKKERFLKGLKKNNVVVYLLAVVLTILLIIILEIQMSNGLLAELYTESHYLLNAVDHIGHVSYSLTEYKNNPPREYPIYFVGGSSSGTIFYSPDYLEDSIYQTYNKEIQTELLFTNGQSYLDAVLIIDNLPQGSGAVVMSSVPVKLDNPAKLSYGTAMKNMPVDSQAFNDAVKTYYPDDGIPIYRLKSGHIFKRFVDRVFISPKSFFIDYTYSGEQIVDETQPVPVIRQDIYDLKVSETLKAMNDIDETDLSQFNEILGIIAQLCKEKDLELILIDLPYDEEVIGDITYNGRPLPEFYSEINQEFADRYDNVTYLSYVNDIEITHEDYSDIKHVVAYDKRRAYIDGLVENIGFLFK